MKVFTPCKKCKSELSTATSTHTRIEFAISRGDTFKVHCKACGTQEQYHVDEFCARKSLIARTMAVATFVLGTPLVIFLVSSRMAGEGLRFSMANPFFIAAIAGVLLMPGAVYVLAMRQDRARVSAFNRSKLRGRLSKQSSGRQRGSTEMQRA